MLFWSREAFPRGIGFRLSPMSDERCLSEIAIIGKLIQHEGGDLGS
jgi:hypothetical protein